MVRTRRVASILFASVLPVAMAAAAEMPADHPITIDGIETVCTGTTLEARNDPRWRDYSLKLEFVGAQGQYLGDEHVNITGEGRSLNVHCTGPWLLMKLPAGTYRIAANVADAGRKDVTARVPQTGQTEVIVRFPDAGGAVSKTPEAAS